MTVSPIERPLAEEYTTQPRADKYLHYNFTETENPAAAQEAWRIHAEGYHAMGFVTEDAITEEGFLVPELDKSRGEFTTYFLDINPDNENDSATVRKVNLPPGGSYKDLPAYSLCGGSLSEAGQAYLEGLSGQDRRVKEIGALARTAEANPLAVHELFREIIQDAAGKDEVWFFTVVSSTYDSLAKSFGQENFPIVGEDVAIDDERVNEGITLRPTIVLPDVFVDNILSAYQKAENEVEKRRLWRSFVFFTDGLDKNLMSEQVLLATQAIPEPRS